MKDTRKVFTVYVLWTFLITWFCDGILIIIAKYSFKAGYLGTIIGGIAALGPTISVYILLRKYGEIYGRKNIKEFVADVPKGVANFGVLVVFMSWRLFVFYINGDIHRSKPLYYLVPYLVMQLLLQGGFEEPGWRGFLQPYFEKKYNIIIATIFVSVIWFLWHIPLWFIPNSAQEHMSFIIFYLQLLVNACSLAAIRKVTKSISFCIIYHAWCNTVFLVIPYNLTIGIIVAYTLEAVVSIGVCLIYDKKNEHRLSDYSL
jgi:membrane protease YdiL (CAAX protease family)